MTPHPLNQAVVTQLMYFQRLGQFRHIQAWGFNQRHLEQLKQPSAISALMNARVPWCSVIVNEQVLDRLLNQSKDYEREIEQVDRILRIGGSTEMISEFFALSHQEVALRRQILQLPDRKGRWPVLTEAQEHQSWEMWSREVKRRGANVENAQVMFAIGADVAEKLELPFAVVWGAIRQWIEQGLL